MSLPRRTLRPYAWFALVAFLCGWTLPFLEAHPLGLQDDAACVVIAGWNGSAVPEVDATPADHGQPAHCLVCHLIRAMSGAVSSDVTTLAAPFVARANRGLTHDLIPSAALAAPSSRGPPDTL
ncbi:MAG: hypothetical protein ABI665_01055 [Vicinamibacterales bacterium]